MAATRFVSQDAELQTQLPAITGIKPSGVSSAITRRSTTLTTYHAIVLISTKMGAAPEDIIELTD